MAEDARRLELWDSDADTCDLAGRDLPAAAATAAWNRVNAIAAALKADGDSRTIEQLRADVFLALLRNERPVVQPPQGGTDAASWPARAPEDRPAEQDVAPLETDTAICPSDAGETPRAGGRGFADQDVAGGSSDFADAPGAAETASTGGQGSPVSRTAGRAPAVGPAVPAPVSL
jgi:hypothetical protein